MKRHPRGERQEKMDEKMRGNYLEDIFIRNRYVEDHEYVTEQENTQMKEFPSQHRKRGKQLHKGGKVCPREGK